MRRGKKCSSLYVTSGSVERKRVKNRSVVEEVMRAICSAVRSGRSSRSGRRGAIDLPHSITAQPVDYRVVWVEM